MATVTIDRFGRVLIPKKVREELRLSPGMELALEVENGRLVLARAQRPVLVRKGKALVFDVKGEDDIRGALEWSREAESARILSGSEDIL